MPSILIRILLCISSYFPLVIIFTIQCYMKGHKRAGIAVLAVGTLGLIGLSFTQMLSHLE